MYFYSVPTHALALYRRPRLSLAFVVSFYPRCCVLSAKPYGTTAEKTKEGEGERDFSESFAEPLSEQVEPRKHQVKPPESAMKRSGSSTTSLTDMGVASTDPENRLNIFESGEEGTLDYRLRFAMEEHAHR